MIKPEDCIGYHEPDKLITKNERLEVENDVTEVTEMKIKNNEHIDTIKSEEVHIKDELCNEEEAGASEHVPEVEDRNGVDPNARENGSANIILSLTRSYKTNIIQTATSGCVSGQNNHDTLINSVDNILKVIFSVRPLDLDSKVEIKSLGRPTPDLKLSQTTKNKKESRTRHFTRNIYYRNEWICGCNVRNSLFCFPCLLFGNQQMDRHWSRLGVTDLSHLHEKMKKHENSKVHLQATTELALLGKANIAQQPSAASPQRIAKHNAKVKKNRHILRRIISCVKFCGVFELSLRGHDRTGGSLNHGIFEELINYNAELDIVLKEHLATSSVFKGTSKMLQNDILDCILTVCQNEILNEVQQATFLAIQCDETTDVTNHCQMVIILRYVNGHTLHERFWRFLQIADKTLHGLVTSIQREIDPMINNPNKLIAQSYDGANVMSGFVGSVQIKMREKYQYAYFVHSYAHELNLIMQKAASQNPQARIFFSDLSRFPDFLSNSSHRCDIFEEIVKIRLPHIAPTRWNSNIKLVSVIYENRPNLILCFQEIAEKIENTFTSREAIGLKRTLEDPNFMFWLTIFHKIFPHVDVLCNQFQSRQVDGVQLQEALSNFETSILYIRNNSEAVEEEWQIDPGPKRKRPCDSDRNSVIAKEVCDVILKQIKNILSYRSHYAANNLLTSSSYTSFSKNFPTQIFKTATKMYPILLEERLKTELQVIYSRHDFKQIDGATRTLEFILKNELGNTFPELIKLLKIVMTTPMDTAEAERRFSTSKRVKTFLRNSMSNYRLNALAMLAVNRDFVFEIPNFDEKVLEQFASMKNRCTDFLFKE